MGLTTRHGGRRSGPRVVVVGSANMDLVARLDRLPVAGETRMAEGFESLPGGKGANQAVAAARSGGRVEFVGRIGSDDFGTQLSRRCRGEGLGVRYLGRDPRAPSGSALILVETSGQNAIAVSPGANARLGTAEVRRAEEAFRKADVVLIQLEVSDAAVRETVRLAERHRVPVLLNPAPARSLDPWILGRITCLTPNEAEASMLSGVRITSPRSAARAAQKLRDQGPACVLITMGSAGVFVSGDGIHSMVPGFRVRAVDTVAAGDVFNGAFAVAWSEGRGLAEAVSFGQAAAALSVQCRGAMDSAPRRDEIDRFLLRHD
ncbi:MAG: ribokinase [Verrucomicrobiota bacterium]